MKRNFFLLTTLGILLVATVLVAVPIVSAQSNAPSTNKDCQTADGDPVDPDVWSRYVKVSVPIPGITGELVCTTTGANAGQVERYHYATDLGSYIAGIYRFFVSIVGILAAVMILYGGIRWVLAAGNQSRIQGAKDVIFSAIIGLVIAFTSYLLLYLLNPQLVNYDNLASHLTDVTRINQREEFLCGATEYTDQPAIPARSQGATTVFPDIVEQYGTYAILADYADLLQGTEEYVTPAQFVACGDTATIITDTSACIGSYCGGGGGLCIPDKYKCLNGYLAGSLSWVGDAYVTGIRIRTICTDGQLLTTNFGRSGLVEQLDFNNETFYYSFENRTTPDNRTVASHFESVRDECNANHDGLAGFALEVTVHDDQGYLFNTLPTTDDNFGVGRNCTTILSNKDPISYTDTEWRVAIAEGKLFTLTDFFTGGTISNDALRTIPYECNLDINRVSYPAR